MILGLYKAISRLMDRFRIYERRRIWERHFSDLLKQLNGADLSNEEKRSIDNLFKRRFKYSYISHSFYKQATGRFDERYIPDSVHFCDIDPYFNDWNLAKKIDNKCLYRILFANLPQPKTVVTRENGFWYDGRHCVMAENQAVGRILGGVFLKQATESEGGHGVYYIGENFSKDELDRIISSIGGDIIVQEGIKQSATLSKLNESSVNTIRFFTLLRKDGTPKIYSACLRMGINGSKVDNASSGGIVTGINADGSLKPHAYSANGKRFDVHPTSGVRFDTIKIPKYQELRELVLAEVKLHPHFRQITWDMTLDENDNPIFIEANLRMGEIDFLQLNNGPLYGEDTEEILNEVFGNKSDTK